MTYLEAKEISKAIEADVNYLSAALQKFPAGPMGLIPDAVKETPEYHTTKTAYGVAFAHLRAFNARFVKAFAKEIRAEQSARRAALVGEG